MQLAQTLGLPSLLKIPDGPVKDYLRKLHTALESQHRQVHNDLRVTAGDVRPAIDDTYYLGKNDDDTPFAWKGLILKDTTDGKYYRIECINGVVTATDLTD